MNSDISGYTFTNGTKVTDWLASLPADDRDRAVKVVEAFVTERKPLNMLQVKIRLTAPGTPGAYDDEDADDTPRNPATGHTPACDAFAGDAYRSPGPIRPTVDTHEPAPQPRSHSHVRAGRLTLIVAAVILALAIFTNPGYADHRNTLAAAITRATATAVGQDFETDFFGMPQPVFPDDVIESVVYEVLDSELEYHDYILWSTCTATVGDRRETVSVGAFGLVRPLRDDITIG